MNEVKNKGTTLVLGATGATGKHLVDQLLKMGQKVKVIVRSIDRTPASWKNDQNVSIIQGSVLDISEERMATLVEDCDAIASCLGHNLTFKGLFGKPRRLVTVLAIRSPRSSRSAITGLLGAAKEAKTEIGNPASLPGV